MTSSSIISSNYFLGLRVYDLADLYKAKITIPAAFSCVAENPAQLSGAVRRKVRDRMVAEHILEMMVKDIYSLFSTDEEQLESPDVLVIWDAKNGSYEQGK